MSSASAEHWHALAPAEDGLVYSWGKEALYGNPQVMQELLPKPVEALRGVRVSSVAAAGHRSYAVEGTGEVWAWGADGDGCNPLGHGGQMRGFLPKQIEALRGHQGGCGDRLL
jgi:alpha-tubulin suppressor-like RCC1 family protein